MSDAEYTKRLEDALECAILTIHNYEYDIADEEWVEPLGVNLKDRGFCQGRMYKGAIAAIIKKAGWEKRWPLSLEEAVGTERQEKRK